jgi:hypothetical protein
MTDQPEALRLANELGGVSDALADEAAVELRRLHHENERLKAEFAAEREACAAFVENMDVQHPKYIAAAIRARGTA